MEAIAVAAEIDDKVAEDVQQLLENRHCDYDQFDAESEFAAESYYEESRAEDREWRERWAHLEQSLRHEHRFFNADVITAFDELFDDIDNLSTPDGQPVITQAGPDEELTSLYRARIFMRESDLLEALVRPDGALGPPPPSVASGGRMNAHGYLRVLRRADRHRRRSPRYAPRSGVPWRWRSSISFAPSLCSTSVRFRAWRPEGASLIRSSSAGRNAARSCEDFTAESPCPRCRSVRQSSTSSRRRSPTIWRAAQSPALDGVMFDSVQSAERGTNVVLFGHASSVQSLRCDDGARYAAAHYEDLEDYIEHDSDLEDWPRRYYVSSQPQDPAEKEAPASTSSNGALLERNHGVALSIDPYSIATHRVRGVTVQTDEQDVEWMNSSSRFDGSDLNF